MILQWDVIILFLSLIHLSFFISSLSVFYYISEEQREDEALILDLMWRRGDRHIEK